MMTIHKYTLVHGVTFLQLPEDSEVLTVQMQRESICIWVKVTPDAPMVTRTFEVFGTGDSLPNRPTRYISTIQEMGGALVWHIFEIL